MELLIDCDPEIDESLALCCLFGRKDLRIAGISTMAGNTSAVQAAENVLHLLKLTGREGEIPVCTGAEHPIHGKTDRYPVRIHGHHGVADLELPESSQHPVNQDVCDFLYESACRCDEKPILITLGRLTNIANTLRRHPDFPEKISRVVSMGGAVFTRGNITPEAEANIYGNPEAAPADRSGGKAGAVRSDPGSGDPDRAIRGSHTGGDFHRGHRKGTGVG